MTVAVATIALRWIVEWSARGAAATEPTSVWLLVLLALPLAHAIHVLFLLSGSRTSNGATWFPPRWIWLLWTTIIFVAVALWPWALAPDQYSLAALIVWGVFVAFPAAIVDGRGAAEGTRSLLLSSWRTLVLTIVAVMALVSLVSYLHAVYGSIGSVDFFYYVCIARDMLQTPLEVSENNYLYFPGVYAFWRTVMRVSGDALSDLQLGYLALLVVNGLCVGGVVARSTRSGYLAVLACVWYFVLLSRFEGFAGVSEPLATVWALAGLWVWGGQPLRGRRGLLMAIALGASLGMAVYMKQQAGLIALGAISLLICRPWLEREKQHSWSLLALIPGVAVAVLLMGILWEGRGWVPLHRGLHWAAGYGREGSLLGSLYTQIRGDESAALAAGLTLVTWCVLFAGAQRAKWIRRPAFQVASFALMAFLLSMAQFLSRPFGHYMLLGIPWLIIACLVLAHELWLHAPAQYTRSYLVSFLVMGAAGVLLANSAGRTDTFYVWRPLLPAGFQLPMQWHEEPLRALDITRLREVIPEGSSMYVVAPRRNVVYYLLESHTANPAGYQFVLCDLQAMPWDRCQFVLLPITGLDENDLQLCSPAQRKEIRQHLVTLGFRRRLVTQLRTMELYEHPAAN
ncbi:MAG: hypothetical protein ACYC0X_16095 [Pirellulaceae bacterium]